MKKGYRISAHTKEMLKRYGSWDAGRFSYEVNAYPKIFGDPKKSFGCRRSSLRPAQKRRSY